MTEKKRNERVFGTMMRTFGYYVHKFGDVRYAHCPKCNSSFPLPKAEKKPDFLVAMTYRFVEAKGAGDSWHFADDFRPNQREFMDLNIDRSWIFVEIGSGNAPKGKQAFLMPWSEWKEYEYYLLQSGSKSLILESTERSRSPELKSIIPPKYFVEWKGRKWSIPNKHPWWLMEKINDQDEEVTKIPKF